MPIATGYRDIMLRLFRKLDADDRAMIAHVFNNALTPAVIDLRELVASDRLSGEEIELISDASIAVERAVRAVRILASGCVAPDPCMCKLCAANAAAVRKSA